MLIGRDDGVHLGGGLHREQKVVLSQPHPRQLVGAVGHTRGEGVIDQVAVTPAAGSVLPQDGEILAHAIPQNSAVPAADLAADGIWLHVAVDLADGAFLQQHEGEAAVDHPTYGGGAQGGGHIPHTGEGQLGGEEQIFKSQRPQAGGGGGIGGIEAEIAVEAERLHGHAHPLGGTAEEGEVTDIPHQQVADTLLQGGGQLCRDRLGLAVKDDGRQDGAPLFGGQSGGVSLPQGQVKEIIFRC